MADHDDFREELRKLGITARTIDQFEKELSEKAKYKQVTKKFRNISKALNILRESVLDVEDAISIDYSEYHCDIKIETCLLSTNGKSHNAWIEAMKLCDSVEMIVIDNGNIQITLTFMKVFEI